MATRRITDKTIYNIRLILTAYSMERQWYKSLGLDSNGRADKIMLFVIKHDMIKSTKLVNRSEIFKYKSRNNEYYLDRNRDSGDVRIDYNLAPVQKLVDLYNGLY